MQRVATIPTPSPKPIAPPPDPPALIRFLNLSANPAAFLPKMTRSSKRCASRQGELLWRSQPHPLDFSPVAGRCPRSATGTAAILAPTQVPERGWEAVPGRRIIRRAGQENRPNGLSRRQTTRNVKTLRTLRQWRTTRHWLPVIAATLAGLSRTIAEPEATPADRDLSELSLDDLLQVKVQTVTAAGKRSQSLSDAPSAVSVISSDDIRKFGYQNLGEVLAATRGFYTSNDRNYTYLGVRGFGRPGDYNSRVLILINGQRINDNVTGGALIGTEFLLDVDLIDRVEIVRGPGSSLYGSNAFFAVVNVITRQGRDIGGVETAFTTGSYDLYGGRFSYGKAFKNDVDLMFSGSLRNRAGHSSLYYAEYDTPPDSDGFTRRTDGERTGSFFGRLSWKDLSIEGAWSERLKHVPTGAFETVFGDPRNQTIDGNYYTRLRLDHEFENGIHLDASVGMSYYYYDGIYIYEDDPPTVPVSTYRFIDQIRGRWLTEEVQVRRTWWDRLTTTLGVEARQNLAQDQINYEDRFPAPSVPMLNSERSSQTWGPFVDVTYNVLTNLSVSAGARYDRGDFSGSALSPRASLIYRPVRPTTLKLLYGQAFRGPNAYERFYTDGITQTTNPDLKPETIDTYEAVVEQELGEHFKASAAGYVYYVNDLIDQVTAGSYLVYRNVEQVRGRGIELELSGRFPHGARGRVSYCLQQAEDLGSHRQLSNSPEHLIQGGISVPLYADKVFAGVNLRYLSARTSAIGADVPPYFVLDLILFSHRWVNGLELSASVYNVLDRRIVEPAPLELRQPLLEQDGRTFQVKLQYRF